MSINKTVSNSGILYRKLHGQKKIKVCLRHHIGDIPVDKQAGKFWTLNHSWWYPAIRKSQEKRFGLLAFFKDIKIFIPLGRNRHDPILVVFQIMIDSWCAHCFGLVWVAQDEYFSNVLSVMAWPKADRAVLSSKKIGSEPTLSNNARLFYTSLKGFLILVMEMSIPDFLRVLIRSLSSCATVLSLLLTLSMLKTIIFTFYPFSEIRRSDLSLIISTSQNK